jgi:hypothetical protein
MAYVHQIYPDFQRSLVDVAFDNLCCLRIGTPHNGMSAIENFIILNPGSAGDDAHERIGLLELHMDFRGLFGGFPSRAPVGRPSNSSSLYLVLNRILYQFFGQFTTPTNPMDSVRIGLYINPSSTRSD